MTDENKFDAQSRRKFLKTTGAVGVASVAGFGGNAVAQQQGNQIDITGGDTTQTGAEQFALSLVSVQINNINAEILNQNNVQVFINDTLVNIEDVTVVGGDVLDLDIQDVNVAVGAAVNVVVAILGAAGGAAGNATKLTDETDLIVDSTGDVSEL